jgi:TRAP-type mannitol/chloroaromatic compound transport system permease large subunit
MDPLFLGALVAILTIVVLFSGVSVAIGLLIVSAGFLITFDGLRSLELMPEILFGKLDSFALLSIPMFIIMGSSIASTRAGADLYEALERWLTRVPGGLVISNLGACALFARCLARALQLVRLLVKWVFQRCASVDILTALLQALLRQGEHWVFLFHPPLQ